jgi:Mrp family chromosome partitioning ATPase
MRGPMAGKVVTQMLKGTDWGDLDVLILDLPPGTGDVQLQVLQDVQLSGAVAVSTPSKLAVVDTVKGIGMFNSLGVPTLAVVENMSYFMVCEAGVLGCFFETNPHIFLVVVRRGRKALPLWQRPVRSDRSIAKL